MKPFWLSLLAKPKGKCSCDNTHTLYRVLYSGGTVDSVVEQVEENGHLTDIHYPDGGPWGGTLVDRAFKQFLRDVFGEVSFEKFSKEYKADELFLYRNFEIKKQNIEPTASKIRLKLPTRLVDCVGGERALQRRIEQSEYRDEVKLNADKLTVDNRVFVRMFSESKEKLLELIRELFQEDEVSGIEIIILVGGFACSQVIKEAVKTEFSNKHVIVPDGANLAMLKGAVLYGRLSLSLISQSDTDAAVITARHMRYTYGISTAVPFDDQKHPQEYKRIFNGIPKCDNIFRVFFKVGQRVMPGQTTETCEFNPTANCIEVYKTRSKAPEYVLDEGKLNSRYTNTTRVTHLYNKINGLHQGITIRWSITVSIADKNGAQEICTCNVLLLLLLCVCVCVRVRACICYFFKL